MRVHRWLTVGVCLVAAGCGSPEQIATTAGSVIVTSMVAGSGMPSHEIEQVYYLGVYDPQEQVPPSVYRVTVRGQASAISAMRFGSGWVPAGLVDSLTGQLAFDANGKIKVDKPADGELAALETGRRLVLFGPEGFRPAPRGHRLVIVMGATPEAFFNAVDDALGSLANAQREERHSQLKTDVIKVLGALRGQRERLADLEVELKAEEKEQP
jgi:hypothetical protein